ncbi:MAG: hypothetical protein LH629_15900 [Ignavibacteria bacterium]|nr:hypothetical protein [Ignavibacteria bacterium]
MSWTLANAQDKKDEKAITPPDILKIYKALLAGTLENDIDKFHSVCDAKMKEAITKLTLSSVNESVVKLINKDSKNEYIGYYIKDGIEVHLFKITQKSLQDDLVVLLSVKNDKCVGFLLQ